jgi:hypothetical protein
MVSATPASDPRTTTADGTSSCFRFSLTSNQHLHQHHHRIQDRSPGYLSTLCKCRFYFLIPHIGLARRKQGRASRRTNNEHEPTRLLHHQEDFAFAVFLPIRLGWCLLSSNIYFSIGGIGLYQVRHCLAAMLQR